MPSWTDDIGSRTREHYRKFPYPKYSVLGSVRREDTFAFNLEALWARFNGSRLEEGVRGRILLAGSGSFLPYPVSLANPKADIVALDLSESSLFRARLHALRHLRTNIAFVAGDVMDPTAAPGPFHYVDAYGVLHCIPDFAGALSAVEARLADGGLARVMVYSRDGRKDIEEVRKRCLELGITRPSGVRALARRDETVRACLRNSYELSFDEGLADAFLIPYAKTFTIDEVIEAVGKTGLSLLAFGHRGTLPDPVGEVARIRRLEKSRAFPTNLTFYLGRNVAPLAAGNYVFLNPALSAAMRSPLPWTLRLPPKFGPEVPSMDRTEKRFLRGFIEPRLAAGLSGADSRRIRPYLDALVLATRA